MNILRVFLLATLVSTPAVAQQEMGSMPGMKMPMAKEPQRAAAPKRPRAFLRPAKPSTTSSMPGMKMPMAKEPQKGTTTKRPRAFLRPAKPSPHASMPGMNMGAAGTKSKSPSPDAMPGMDMSTPKDKSATPGAASKNAMPGMDMSAPGAAAPSQNAMPGMDHGGMGGMSGMGNMPSMSMKGALGPYPMTRDASGTSWQPDLAEHHGIDAMAGDWSLMGHAMLWGIYDSQSGPRGAEKTYSAGMVMGMARREFASGDALSFRAMLSPDPFMGKSGYPLLLATGETANGKTPLVDRQHPHDLFMEMSGTYSHKLSNDNSVFLYAGYPGEPALGPPAFMHRASGMDIPQAPITHHWLDSTHIAFGVLTGGFVRDDWKLEISQFTGREPDQYRYNFDAPKFDSTALRLSYNPDEHWSLQGSWGHLKSPEQLDPSVNENRTTASASYITKFGEESSVAATLAWGMKDLSDGHRLNGILLEAEYKPSAAWTAFARTEWEQNSEIAANSSIQSVGDLTLGGIHDWNVADHAKLGLGGSYTFDFIGSAVTPTYGNNPRGAMVFARLALE